MITSDSLFRFLKKADQTFPTPLSDKHDLKSYAEKLYNQATLCYRLEEGEIVSLVAGYTENTTDKLSYIAIVATLPEVRGRHLASQLVSEFCEIAKQKNLAAVHLYTAADNETAKKMYYSLGFEEWHTPDEPRPQDCHLILFLK